MIKTCFFKKCISLSITGVLLISSLLLTGCHGSKGLPKFEIPEALDTSRNIEISFWAKNDTNKTQSDVYKKAIEDFQTLYPNIRVNLKLYTDYGRIYNDVITNISTNTTPNVCITYPDHIATYMTGINVVLPLNELMDDPKFGFGGSEVRFDAPRRDEIIQRFLKEGEFNNDYYALPFMRSTEACFINKTLVNKLGYEIPEILTWDFVFEVSEKAMEQNPDGTFKLNGQKVLIPFIYKSTDNMMITMLKQKGAGYSQSDGTIEIFNDTTKSLLLDIAGHADTGAFSTFKISSYPSNFLNAGQCIFGVDSTAGATWMGPDAPLSDIPEEKEVPCETVVRMVPQFDTSNPWMMSQGPSVCIFNKADSQEVLASWLFSQFLLTNDVQIGFATSEGYVPVTQKARDSSEYKEYLSMAGSDQNMHYQIKMDATSLLLTHTDNTFVTPVFNGSASLRDAAGALIEDVCKAVRRNQTVDEDFIDRDYEKVSSLYRLDQTNPASMEKCELGPLPTASIILLSSLGMIWICILAYILLNRRKNNT